MSARVTFTGLEELQEALRALPAALVADATGIVRSEAAAAQAEIYGAYPRRSGKLRDSLSLTQQSASAFGVIFVLKNSAKDAGWFERGTEARHTAIGANRGAMPPGRVFLPRVIRHRRAMYARLAAMLEAHGLIVSGSV